MPEPRSGDSSLGPRKGRIYAAGSTGLRISIAIGTALAVAQPHNAMDQGLQPLELNALAATAATAEAVAPHRCAPRIKNSCVLLTFCLVFFSPDTIVHCELCIGGSTSIKRVTGGAIGAPPVIGRIISSMIDYFTITLEAFAP